MMGGPVEALTKPTMSLDKCSKRLDQLSYRGKGCHAVWMDGPSERLKTDDAR